MKPSALLAKLARVLDPPPPATAGPDGTASPLPGSMSLGLNVRRAAPPGEALLDGPAAHRPGGAASTLAAAPAPSAAMAPAGGAAAAGGPRPLQILLVEDQVRENGWG